MRGKLTPDYRIGCKRILLSNTYYPALSRPHVDLLTSPIDRVTPEGIRAYDGACRRVDAIVLATGFRVSDPRVFDRIVGRGGRSLAEVFSADGHVGYKGSAVAGFPNLFLLMGPNTWHPCLLHMVESQVTYVTDAIATIDRRRLDTVEVRAEAQHDYNRALRRRLACGVWSTGGCSSWLLDEHGHNFMAWPGSTHEFRRLTRTFDVEAYHTTIRPDTSVSMTTSVPFVDSEDLMS